MENASQNKSNLRSRKLSAHYSEVKFWESATTEANNFLCGGTAGWTQVVYVDIANSSHQCPSSFREYTSPARACGRQITTTASCDSAIFGVSGMQYNQVCGRIIAYQIGSPAAFYSALRQDVSIDSWYLEGISLTYTWVTQTTYLVVCCYSFRNFSSYTHRSFPLPLFQLCRHLQHSIVCR